MMRELILLFTMLLLSGCTKRGPLVNEAHSASDTARIEVNFARGFNLSLYNGGILLTVKNPWQHAAGIEFKYLLNDTIDKSAAIDNYTWSIKTPVSRVICLSTTHVGFIEYIGRTGTVAGISGKDYVVNETIRKGISDNRIFDVGYDESLNYELILRLKPDLVFAYGVNVSVTNTVKKLNELGIPVILIGEYLEEDPLGKMEWVKAFAACYGLMDPVSDRFDTAVHRYNKMKTLAEKTIDKPAVLLGLPWRGNWYVSGARSYIARLVRDAGGKYIWDNMDYNESRPMGLEKIYEKALAAEYWINPGEARAQKDIVDVDARFSSLPAVLEKRIYNNDNQLTEFGGNAFYESGVVEPEIILSDLIYILHPHLLPSYQLKYYRKLQ